ncbi:MAG TPA: T9SS type A sorting domain-containing protein, partial [Saprospiraceae bacterium]|nr:T9SS type A sorting domain-containing protein [Saprospiraceae bacterium]
FFFVGSRPKTAIDVIQSNDRGIVLCGSLNYPPVDTTPALVLVLKTDSTGHPIWTKSFPNTSGFPGHQKIIQLPDSSYYFDTDASPGLLHLAFNGDSILAFSVHYNSICPISSGGFASTGYEVCLHNKSGANLWCKDPGYYTYQVLEALDSTIVDLGQITPGIVHIDRWTLNGQRIWNRLKKANFHSIIQLPDKGFMLMGSVPDSIVGIDNYILRVNLMTDSVWALKLPGIKATGIVATADNGCAVVGQDLMNDYQTTIIRINPDGSIAWTRNYFTGYKMDSYYFKIPHMALAADHGFILAQGLYRDDPYPMYAIGLIKTDSMGEIQTTGLSENYSRMKLAIIPNPAVSQIRLTIYPRPAHYSLWLSDITGRTITNLQPESDDTFYLDRRNLPGGLYFLSLLSDQGVITEKLVLTD